MTAADHQCDGVRTARVLVRRLTGVLLEMRSPDGKHRALRSQYSRRGTCEVYREGEHSPLCTDLWAALGVSADWWDAHGERETEQLTMLESEVAV